MRRIFNDSNAFLISFTICAFVSFLVFLVLPGPEPARVIQNQGSSNSSAKTYPTVQPELAPTAQPDPTKLALPESNPSSTTASDVRKNEAARMSVQLSEAIKKRLIKFDATGDGLTSISITLELLADISLHVTIPKGTIFEPDVLGTQHMVILSSREASLDSNRAIVSFSILAACTDMNRKTPTSDIHFTVAENYSYDDLTKLLVGSPGTELEFAL